MNKTTDEWKALEDAIERQSWPEAEREARALLDAWNEVKHVVLWFADATVDARAESLEDALSSLVSLLGGVPVDAEAVEVTKAKVRAFLPPEDEA